MKTHLYLIFILGLLYTNVITGQSKIEGVWKTDQNIMLKFDNNNSFVHTMPDKEFTGTYLYTKKSDNTELIKMTYSMGEKVYRIKLLTSSSLIIVNTTGDQELKFKKVKVEETPDLMDSDRHNQNTENYYQRERIESTDNEGGLKGVWSHITDAPDHFQENSIIFRASLGLIPDLTIQEVEANLSIPPIVFQLEKQIYNNFGVSGSFGYARWSSSLGYLHFNQINAGLRGNYHVNTIDQLDTYLSLGLSYRYMNAVIEGYTVYNHKLTVVPVIGASYYFNTNFGANIELGNDNISWLKLGLAYKLR